MKTLLLLVFVALVGWSCSDLGVDPRFGSDTTLQPLFSVGGGGLDSLSTVRLWFDTAAVAAENRGVGTSGADIDSSYITRIALSSDDASWPLGNLAAATLLVNGDTVASATLPDFIGTSFIYPDSTLTRAAQDLHAMPGDSMNLSLLYTLRGTANGVHPVTASITIETIGRFRIE